jgi:putative protein-disulfide isomerase
MKECIFVVDPMCSWCYGFSPVLETVREQYKEKYDFSLVVGGLRTKGQMQWSKEAKAYLQGHWEEVSKKTGQIFSNLLFGKIFFEYDTYPACKAVVSVRECFGMQEAFKYLYLLQEAFYLKGKDVTSIEVLVEILQLLDFDSGLFETFYRSDRAELLMQHDFAKACSMGANAFPSLVIIDEDGHMVCQKGYRDLTEMNNLLKDNDA